MADLFETLSAAPADIVTMVADGLERRAEDPAQQEILETYIRDIELPEQAHVLEIGCGTGVVCRRLAALEGVERIVGLDPVPGLIERARSLARGDQRIHFDVRNGLDTGLESQSFHAVFLHTLLSHVKDQSAILEEAHRVLKPRGCLAVCDADFSKTSVSIGAADPLQACVDAWVAGHVTDRWLVPRLPGLLSRAGFDLERFRGYNRVDITGIGTGPTWVEMGADALAALGQIGPELCQALKAECGARVASGRFYASLPFASAVCMKR